MLINELLENAHFNSEHFTKQTEDGNELDFDLTDDLVFYMNTDDEVYRRYLLPAVHIFIDKQKKNVEFNYTIFKNAVATSYKQYIKQYPIRELPNDIDKKTWKSVCKKLFDQVKKDMKDGHYDHN